MAPSCGKSGRLSSKSGAQVWWVVKHVLLFACLKEREQQRLDKIHSLQKTVIQTAMDNYAQTQKDIEETVKTKEEIAAENREKRLREKLDRINAKKAHAEEVRKRRLLAVASAPDEAADDVDIVNRPLPAIGNSRSSLDRSESAVAFNAAE